MTKKEPCVTRSAFDAQAAALRSELKARLEAVEPIGATPPGTDVWDKILTMGSKLVVTELRPVVKERLGAPFPLKFVKKGGYETPEDVVEHLMPQLRNWCPPDVVTHAEGSANGATASSVVH